MAKPTHVITLHIAKLEPEGPGPDSHGVSTLGVDLSGDEIERRMQVKAGLRAHADMLLGSLDLAASRVLREAPAAELPPFDERTVEVLIGGRLAVKWEASEATSDEDLADMLRAIGRDLFEQAGAITLRRPNLPEVATVCCGKPQREG